MSGLVGHIERYLGQIECGWAQNADRPLRFKVVRLAGSIADGAASFSTLGLSSVHLTSRASDKAIHLELVMFVSDSVADQIPGILGVVGTEMIERESALLRGDVVGPRGALFPSSGSRMEALYAALPVYLPDEFATYREGDVNVVFVWLIPITSIEARFVRENGWRRFEDALVSADPDLTDVFRASLYA